MDVSEGVGVDGEGIGNAPTIEEVLGRSSFTLYYVDALDSLTRSVVDNYREISGMLMSLGVQGGDIVRANVNANSDRDLYEWVIQRVTKEFRPPVVFMGNLYLGDYFEVKRLFDSGDLKRIFEKGSVEGILETHKEPQETDGSPPIPQLNIFDKSIEVVEIVLDYLNPLSYWRHYSKTPEPPPKPTGQYTDLEVIHTNWYGRNQTRIFRFTENELQRVHPNGSVRAVNKYADINRIYLLDDTRLVLYYTSGSPDWIGAAPEIIKKFLSLLKPATSSSLIYIEK